MSSSTTYHGVQKRFDVLNSIKYHVIDSASPCLTDEVKASAEIIIKNIHSYVAHKASETIIVEIIAQTFQEGTDGYQTILGIYKFDQHLFDQVLQKVFDKIAIEENFHKITKSLEKLKDNGAKVEAYCKLYTYKYCFFEDLIAFENIVKKFLKDENLKPSEKEELKKLLKALEKDSSAYLLSQSIASSIEYDY